MVTLGPATHSVDVLRDMLDAGMSVARVDCTWGTVDYHKKTLANLNEAMRQRQKLCAVMVDIRGRELMIERPHSTDDNGWPKHGQILKFKASCDVLLLCNFGRRDSQR